MDVAPSPAPTRVTLLPMSSAPSATGPVLSYHAGPAGLAVQLTADLPEADVVRLDGMRVWVTAEADDGLVAFQAVVRQAGGTAVEVTGISVPVEEHRRRQLRAPARVPARLGYSRSDEETPTVVWGHTLDLSRGGCRLDLGAGAPAEKIPPVGASTAVTMDLEDEHVEAVGEVLRADPATGEVAVRFSALDRSDADRIERQVLSVVVPRR